MSPVTYGSDDTLLSAPPCSLPSSWQLTSKEEGGWGAGWSFVCLTGACLFKLVTKQ